MMQIINNPQRLAKLLASLNVPGSNRPLSPVEVANEIDVMRADLDGDLKEVIRRLPVSPHIVKEFLYLGKLPPKIQDVVTWGESSSEDGSIGFSVAAKMSRLSNHNDILKLAGTILGMTRPITKEEVKGVLSLKKTKPDKPIEECIREVLNVTRQVTIHHFLFICNIKSTIATFLVNSGSKKNPQDQVLAALNSVFPTGTLKNIKVRNERVRLALDEEGWKFISTYTDRHSLARQDVVNHMLESAGFVNGIQ